MAEGLGRYYHGDKYTFFSAGVEKSALNPRAKKVMDELGIDIQDQYSKHIDELKDVKLNTIVTVCSHANETCPVVPGSKIIHVGFDDPPELTKEMTNEEEILEVYRRVRDEIKSFILKLETYLC